MVLEDKTDFTLSSLIDAAYDSYLPAFEPLIPALLRSYDETPASNALKGELADQIEVLRGWDYRWGVESVATSLATYWAEHLLQRVGPDARAAGVSANDYAATRASAEQRRSSSTSEAGRRLGATSIASSG